MSLLCCTPLQGQVYGKPVNQGITQLKPNRNHRAMAEERVGRKIGGLRVLNSYWVNQVSAQKEACSCFPHQLLQCSCWMQLCTDRS